MDALIFDFDGVVVNSEPVHFACFKQVLAEEGIELTSDEYYGKYLGFDDFDCFDRAMAEHARQLGPRRILDLIARKTACVKEQYARGIELMPGAMDLILSARAADIPTAVCSGALRREIELAAKNAGVWDCFHAVVSAEDVEHSKPDPEGYRQALSKLCRLTGRALCADRSIVIEDSPAGIAAAHAAGMKVVGLTGSRPAAELSQADRVVASLADVTIAKLEEIIQIGTVPI